MIIVLSHVQYKTYMNNKCTSPSQTFKLVSNSHSITDLQQIGQTSIVMFIKEYFPHLYNHNDKINLDLHDNNFYEALKNLIESYQNLTQLLPYNKQNVNSMIGAQFRDKNQKSDNIEFEGRKNTRAAFAMRNSKNQQQLKKDQIFVRLIPRTHNCIHFMVKNQNFPRIQCKLSCNQHLEYLINYLTNKWLRGKVGVGYQIKLYPDPSTYMQKHSNQTKRPNVIHQPLNNYLMFTDIMAAFGVAQNGCINLLYDIVQLRKQKDKDKQKFIKSIVVDKQHSLSSQNYNIKVQRPINQGIDMYQKQSTPQKNGRKKQPKNHNINSEYMTEQKLQQNIKLMLDNHDQRSMISKSKQKRSYLNNNSIDFSQVNSIGYQFNAFNSNQILGNIFNVNNSNTFLMGPDRHSNVQNIKISPIKQQRVQNNKQQNKVSQQSPKSGKSHVNSSPKEPHQSISAVVAQNKLQNIRNFINIIEKQVCPAESVNQLINKQQNSLNKCDLLVKKQVKTLTIIKKKNANQ